MSHSRPARSLIFRSSYGTHLLDHLSLAQVAGFGGSEVAVIALLEVDADFLGCLHLELVHRLARLGNEKSAPHLP